MLALYANVLTLMLYQFSTNIQDDDVVCQNWANCAVNYTSRCMCPLGTTGQRCDRQLDIKYPKFDGTAYLGLAHLTNAEREFNFSLTFRPESNEGLLLFSAQTIKANRDFFAVILKDGFVVFRFDCGSGLAVLRSTTRVNLNAWNKLVIRRVGRRGKLQLNNEQPFEGLSQGKQKKMTLNLNLYVGGCHFMSLVSRRIDTTHQFVGCIQELLINGRKVDFTKRRSSLRGESEFGLNVEACEYCHVCEIGGTCTTGSANESVCLCPLGFYGDSCTKSQHAPHFSGHSYIDFEHVHLAVENFTDIEIVFKSNSRDGLLLYDGVSQSTDGNFVSFSLRNGFLEFRFDLGSGMAVLRSSQSLTLDSWHIARVSRSGRKGTLKVDDQALVTGQSPGTYTSLSNVGKLYIGGHPNFTDITSRASVTGSFSGCIQKVGINKRSLNLMGYTASKFGISPCSDLCDGVPCLNEELYRSVLYKISGKFGHVLFRKYRNNLLHSSGSRIYELSVRPINTTLFPNKESFYVTQVSSGRHIGKFLMTLKYAKERLVQVNRYYFLPDVQIPGEIAWPTFFNTLTWNHFNTTIDYCDGSLYLINSTNIETVGTLNNCDHNRQNIPEYNLDITCSEIIISENSAKRYTEYNLRSKERPTFPTGWRVTPC